MTCPNCGGTDIYVVDTLNGEDGYIYRRRKCRDCNTKFRTAELKIKNDMDLTRGYVDAFHSKTKSRYRKE